MKNAFTKVLLVTALLLGTSVITHAQSNYNTAIGGRFGGLTSGITLKTFIAGNAALEGIVSFGSNSFIITGLYEQHNQIAGAPGLQLLYGIGGHIGFFDEGGSYYTFRGNRVYTKGSVVGMDLILGLDYKFKGAPINIGLDIKPIVDFFDGTQIYFDSGLSVRLTF